MASTLKPFRQYNEHEVLNMFSWAPTAQVVAYDDDSNASTPDIGPFSDAQGDACVNMKVGNGSHTWDAGRLLISDGVEMKSSTQDWDPVTMNDGAFGASGFAVDLKKYLGANYNAATAATFGSAGDGSHVGLFGYPNATLTASGGSLTSASEAAVGISLRSTMAYDENNEKLLYYTTKLDELQAVLPGQAVPCLRRGLIAMEVDGLSTGDTGKPLYGFNEGVGAAASDVDAAKAGLVTVTSTSNGAAIGEIVAVMDVAAKIALVQIDV